MFGAPPLHFTTMRLPNTLCVYTRLAMSVHCARECTRVILLFNFTWCSRSLSFAGCCRRFPLFLHSFAPAFKHQTHQLIIWDFGLNQNKNEITPVPVPVVEDRRYAIICIHSHRYLYMNVWMRVYIIWRYLQTHLSW